MISDRERGRRRLVKLIMLVYLLLIFEGAIRKWMFPHLGQVLFFIRDPFVLLAYALALRHGFFPKGNPMLLTGLALAACAVLLAGVQLLAPAASWGGALLAVYGWRNYFFYIPLAFVIAEVFERPDIERLVRWTLILAIPTAVLVFVQFIAPIDSPINVGIGGVKELQFHGLSTDGEHTRPMGFFTSDLGEKGFTVSALAMALSLWLLPPARRFVKFWFLFTMTCAVLACLAVSGSRGAMVHSGIVMLGAIACAVLLNGRGVSIRAVIWPTVIVVAAVVLYPILFPEAFEAFTNRWTSAAISETSNFGSLGIFGRALYGFIDFFNLMGDTPLAGYGLGLAGNARITLGIEIEGLTHWAETDWARQIVDLGPVMGVIFIGYRIVFTGWLGLGCLAGARRIHDPLPFLLFSFIGVDLLYGLLTGHGSVNGYVWLFTGFSLAAARAPLADRAAERAETLYIRQPRFANLMR
jgi:hypothetical protein